MKKHLKSILTATLALALCATMAGCGISKPRDPEDINEKDAEEAIAQYDAEYGNRKQDTSSAEVQRINPFENLQVTFKGIAPYISIAISGGDSSVVYTPSAKNGIENGDIITITAKSKQSDITLTETDKKYTAEGLSAYVISLDEIPDEMKEKMQNQAKDNIQADCASWREGNSLLNAEFLGYYFLHAKEGFSLSPYNEIYCVFKMTASITGLKRGGDGETQETGEEVYYTCYHYSDIMMLPDGTCSVDLSQGTMTSNTIKSDYGYYDFIATFYSYNGYKDIDSMFNECVAKQVSSYEYENTVKE